LRRALQFDLPFQAAARPSSRLDNFLELLEERLTGGYQYSGFPFAEVSDSKESDQIVVQIKEGRHVRMGKIRVVAPPALDGEAFVHWLTTPQTARPWNYIIGDATDPRRRQSHLPPEDSDSDTAIQWAPGKSLRFGRHPMARLSGASLLAAIEQGFPFSKVTPEINYLNDGTAELVATVEYDQLPSRIDEIEITGLKRDTREKLLAYLEVAPGDRFSHDVMQRIDERLKYSCRYWKRDVRVHIVPARKTRYESLPDRVVVRIELDEYPHTPPLGEPLRPADEVLRTAAEWLNAAMTEGAQGDVVCQLELDEKLGLPQGAGSARVVAGTGGGFTVDARWKLPQGWRIDHSVLLTPDAWEVIDWNGGRKLVLPLEQQVYFDASLTADYRENGDRRTSLKFGPGFRKSSQKAGPQRVATVSIEPVALVHEAHRDNTQIEFKDGTLRLTSPQFQSEIDVATGRWISLKLLNTAATNGASFSATFEEGAFAAARDAIRERAAAFPNVYHDDRPCTSVAAFALDQAAIQFGQLQRTDCVAACELGKRILAHAEAKKIDETWNWFWDLPKPEQEHKFTIPNLHKSEASANEIHMALAIPHIADRLFPRGSWPWVLARELCFAKLSDGKADPTPEAFAHGFLREIARLVAADEIGPIGHRIIPDSLKPPELRSPVVVERISSDQAFLRDIQLNTEGDHLPAALCRAAVDELGRMPDDDRDQLLKLLPEPVRPAVVRLAARRLENPGEAPEAALREFLLFVWQKGLREVTEARMRKPAGGPSSGALDRYQTIK
jgi:hypothetical protein